jgi:hypothetical protein
MASIPQGYYSIAGKNAAGLVNVDCDNLLVNNTLSCTNLNVTGTTSTAETVSNLKVTGTLTTTNNTLDDGSVNGIIRVGAAKFSNNGGSNTEGFGFAAGFVSPIAGRILIGDGSGWSVYFSAVNYSGVFSDVARISDGGIFQTLSGGVARNTLDDGTGNMTITSNLTCHQRLYSHFGAIVGGGGMYMDQYGSLNFNGGVAGNAWQVNDQNGRGQFKVYNQDTGANAGAVVRTFNNILDDGNGSMNIAAYTLKSAAGTVTATGTTQGTAAALPSNKEICPATCSGAGQGVVLPTPPIGATVTVINQNPSNTILVYPPTSMGINNLATNAGYSLGTVSTARFYYISTNQWYTV